MLVFIDVISTEKWSMRRINRQLIVFGLINLLVTLINLLMTVQYYPLPVL